SLFTLMATEFFKSRGSAGELGMLLASLTMTVLIVLFGEITPKTFAAQNAEPYALIVAQPLTAVVWLASPLVRLFTSITNVFVRFFNRGFRSEHAITPFVTEDEIRMLVDVGHKEGVFEQEETEMIHSVIELGDTTVREIMVPRMDITALSAEATFDEVIKTSIDEGRSRIPIYQETSDNIIGVLYVKDLLEFLRTGERPFCLPTELIHPAFYVPETKRIDDLLKEMRRAKIHLAIVIDEYGGTAGLVSIEDILEEIVGEIQDEYDSEELQVETLDDGSMLIDGKLPIDEVNELFRVKLPTEEFETIGGFVVGLLGRAPTLGEEVTFQQLRIVIDSVEQRRLSRVRIWRLDTAPLSPDALENELTEKKEG
ncbi:MAG: hemolysin family protein, partial [Bacteroidota bacterium]